MIGPAMHFVVLPLLLAVAYFLGRLDGITDAKSP